MLGFTTVARSPLWGEERVQLGNLRTMSLNFAEDAIRLASVGMRVSSLKSETLVVCSRGMVKKKMEREIDRLAWCGAEPMW